MLLGLMSNNQLMSDPAMLFRWDHSVSCSLVSTGLWAYELRLQPELQKWRYNDTFSSWAGGRQPGSTNKQTRNSDYKWPSNRLKSFSLPTALESRKRFSIYTVLPRLLPNCPMSFFVFVFDWLMYSNKSVPKKSCTVMYTSKQQGAV